MFLTPNINQWGFQAGNLTTTRPVTSFGLAITAGAGAYGTYGEILSDTAVTTDCYGIYLMFNGHFASGSNHKCIATIGIDPAGGTSYVDTIPDLLVSKSSGYSTQSGINYFFPIFIPAGSAIACKLYGDTTRASNVGVKVVGKPSHPELIRVGSKVRAYGVVAPTGTDITTGTVNEGAWAEMGTIAAGDRPFFWQWGFDVDTTAATASMNHIDIGIGDATNKAIVSSEGIVQILATENIQKQLQMDGYYDAAPGDIVYARSQGIAAGVSNKMAVYGVI